MAHDELQTSLLVEQSDQHVFPTDVEPLDDLEKHN
jgi:hypothetical protein